MLSTLLITAAVVGIGALHWFLTRLEPVWPGAVVPALWVGAAAWFFARGPEPTAFSLVALVLGSGVLLQMWVQARRTEEAAPAAVTE